jgi:hypothetical protein
VHTIPVFRENKGNEKMRHIEKVYVATITAFLTLSLALLSIAVAAGAITLTPPAQAPGGSVSVNGTGFGATKAVGIGFGAEVAVTGEDAGRLQGSGTGPWTGRIKYYPIKPGSFVMQSNVEGVIVDYTDKGDGTLASTSTYFVSGTINYTSGVFSRTSTTDLSGYADTMIHTVGYTRYAYNVTPAAGVTTSPTGTFTASITVPNVANGNYNVTAIDSQGNRAYATLTVDSTIPEGLTVGVIVLLSTVAVIVSTRYLRKRPKIESCGQAKL